MKRIVARTVLVMFSSLSLFTCGGGGGGGGGISPETYSISGTVSGAVTSGVTITLTGASSGTTTTDASGNYTFTGRANGSYTVTPGRSGYAFSPASGSITISGANSAAVNFTATSSAGAIYSISGTVSGAVTSGVTMTLAGAATRTTTTGVGGTYSFTALGNGTYMVTPTLAGNTFTPTSRSVTTNNDNATGINFTASSAAAVLQSTGPFGALMIEKNGEMLLPMVDRDASDNATKITGALYTNTVTGDSVLVYLDADGMPSMTVVGDYILLFSNWSADGKTVDIAKIFTPTNYIEVFKGVSVNASSAAIRGISVETRDPANRNLISIRATCFPACDSDVKNLADLLKIAGLGISVGSCAVATTVSIGATALPCLGLIVSTASLVVGDEVWLGKLAPLEDYLGGIDVFQCALLPVLGDATPCFSAALDMSSRALNLHAKIVDGNSALIATAHPFLTNPNQQSGVVQQGSGLPSCSGAYECTPGGAMSYLPCYPDGVRECGAGCTWGPCVGTCGDGTCDTSIAGENPANCPSDCQTVCGDSVCAAGEETTCPQDCASNSCCVSTNNCPTETPYECGAGCCCCGYGSVCAANHACS